MSEENERDEWLDYMQEKLFSIIDNSNDLYDVFQEQGEEEKKVISTHQKTEKFSNISSDEVLYVADCLSNLVYATPLYEDFFYVHTNDCREMLFFTNGDELKDYREKNNNCQFVYLRFRDLLTLKSYFDLDLFTVILNDYVLSFSRENIESFYNIVAYENMNLSSNYVVGQPSESYEKAIERVNSKFKEYEEINNVWLLHVLELKKKTETVVNDKYEEMYDVFVVEMPEENYILIRDYINNVTMETNNHKVKVVLYNSDLGEFLVKENQSPIYTKN